MIPVIGGEALVIGVAVAHRLFEYRRVGGNAGQPVFVDKFLESALGKKCAIDEIEPDGLALRFEVVEQAHHFFSSISLATLTTLWMVNPNLSCSLVSGADAPKVDIVAWAAPADDRMDDDEGRPVAGRPKRRERLGARGRVIGVEDMEDATMVEEMHGAGVTARGTHHRTRSASGRGRAAPQNEVAREGPAPDGRARGLPRSSGRAPDSAGVLQALG